MPAQTQVQVTQCPPAIAQGANVNYFTRRQVAAARRAFKLQQAA